MSEETRDWFRAYFRVAIGMWVICGGPVCWYFRDGIGPDPQSQGIAAAYRFLATCWWGPVMGVLLALLAALSIDRTEPRA